MSEETASDVRVWAITSYPGRRRTTYTVRWRVAEHRQQRTFATRKLAETFHAQLVHAMRDGIRFRLVDGMPANSRSPAQETSWYTLATTFIDMKWSSASPKHRKSLAEALVTVTGTLTNARQTERLDATERSALLNWAFNTGARGGVRAMTATAPARYQPILENLAQRSLPMKEAANPVVIRRVLDALAVRLDGSPASSATFARKRSAFYGALDYAVELRLLPANPLDALKINRRPPTMSVDRRSVVNPDQAARLLSAVADLNPPLEAFFACLYYAALRPAEARHLRMRDCDLPGTGWGSLLLVGSSPTISGRWTDEGTPSADRQLKHRDANETRPVPATPELVAIPRRHISSYGSGVDGRLFVTRTGRAGVPISGPHAAPISMGIVYRTWQAVRVAALTPEQAASPLARRPYDLRHAAVSLWLNAGVPPTQVAEWAGHSVNVLLRVYAKVIDGHQAEARNRIQAALATTETSARIPHRQP